MEQSTQKSLGIFGAGAGIAVYLVLVLVGVGMNGCINCSETGMALLFLSMPLISIFTFVTTPISYSGEFVMMILAGLLQFGLLGYLVGKIAQTTFNRKKA